MKNLLLCPLVALCATVRNHCRALALLLLAVSAAAPHASAQWSVVFGSLQYGGNAAFQYAGTFPDVSYTFLGEAPTYVAYVFKNPDGTEKGWSGPMGGTPGDPVPSGANGIWDQYGTYTVEFWYLNNPSLGVFDRQTLVSTYQFTITAPTCHLTTGTAGPGSGSVTPASSDYTVGTNADVTASADPGNRFDYWVINQGGTVVSPNPTSPTYTLTMSADTTATAYFEPTSINVSFSLQNTSATYTGGTSGVTVVPSDSGAHYTVTYNGAGGTFGPYSCVGTASPPGPVGVGTYDVAITGSGNYVSITPNPVGSFTIAPEPVTFSFSNTSNGYTGRSFAATVTPSDPAATFTSNLNYGPDVGTSTASATANGNYTGSGQATATVNPASVSFTFGNTNRTYTGGTFTASVKPSDPAATFTGNLSYGPDVGTWTVLATANGNYSGSGQTSATVTPEFVSFGFGNTNQTYTGGTFTASVTPSDPAATFTANATYGPDVGTSTVSATATGNYGGTGQATATVTPALVSFTFSNNDQTYTGSALSATVTANPSMATFTASLTGGPAVGSYAISAAGTGNFAGSGSSRLDIRPARPFRTVLTSVAPVSTGTVNGAGVYAEGASATLTAVPDATHVFTSWSGDVTGTTNPLTFTVGAQNYSVVANFSPKATAAKVKYQGGSRALLDSGTTKNGAPLVIKGS